MKTSQFAVASATIACMVAFATPSFSQSKLSGVEKGTITVPENFRTNYEFLGAWGVKGEGEEGSNIGQHIVYASPGTIKAFRETGKFEDGTVLVKELFNGKTETLTTGEATSATDVAGYFVMIKDAAGTNQGPLWGDGWGWAFFKPDNTQATVSTDYQADCLSCHEPVRDSDLVFSYAYPVLKR